MATGVRRKLANGREAAAPADLALLRGFRKALPRVADDTLGMALNLIGANQRRMNSVELADGLDNGWLLLGLCAPHLSRAGVLMDPVLVSALVQHQTLGAVADDISAERSLTGTDAALAAPLIDDLLKAMRDTTVFSALRVDRRVPDVRALLLPFDAESYLRAELTVDIAVGAHQGRMIFLLPDAPPPEQEEPDHDPTERPLMKDTALVVKAELRAVLARLSLPLDALEKLQVGQVLPLLDARMDKTDLISIDGRRVATARLGQADGFRAVRLNPVGHKPPPLEDSFTAHATARAQGNGAGLAGPMGLGDDFGAHQAAPGDGFQDLDGLDTGLPGLDDGSGFDAMAPEAAAAEISELAGLPPLEDLGGDGSDGAPGLPDLPDMIDPMAELAQPMTDLPNLSDS
ncbi:MAG: FliM/FliN family flagellar motor switch protein [Pseudomonadota bacterium]